MAPTRDISCASYLMKWGVLIHHKKGDKNGITNEKKEVTAASFVGGVLQWRTILVRVNTVGIFKDESE